MFSVSTFACPHLSHVNEHSTVIPHGAFAEQPSTEIYEGTGALITEQLAAGNGKARLDRIATHRQMRCELCDYHVACPHGIQVETSMNATLLSSPRRLSTRDVASARTHHDHRSTPTSGRWWRSRSIDRVLVATIDLRRRAA